MQEYRWPLMKDTMTFCDRLKLAKFAMSSRKFTQGPKVKEFEDAWSEWIGPNNSGHYSKSIFVTSGSAANLLLVDAMISHLGLKPGDKVIVPSVTWVTNINPIIQLGLEPVFVDVNLSDFSFDIASLKRAYSAFGEKIKLIFVTHLLGFPAPVEEYKKIFPNATFIDDACESHGAKDYANNKVGSNTIGATFSFYYGHHMSTIEGGMITTNDDFVYETLLMKRSHGLSRNSQHSDTYAKLYRKIDPQFLFVETGYNFRNTEMAAVLGLSQLPRLDSYIENRRNIYSKFVDMIKPYVEKAYIFYPLSENEGNSSFCLPFICKTNDIKNMLIDAFISHGIEYRPVVGGNLLCQPYLSKKSYQYFSETNNSEVIHNNGIYIGNNQFVTMSDMDFLEGILKKTFGGY